MCSPVTRGVLTRSSRGPQPTSPAAYCHPYPTTQTTPSAAQRQPDAAQLQAGCPEDAPLPTRRPPCPDDPQHQPGRRAPDAQPQPPHRHRDAAQAQPPPAPRRDAAQQPAADASSCTPTQPTGTPHTDNHADTDDDHDPTPTDLLQALVPPKPCARKRSQSGLAPGVGCCSRWLPYPRVGGRATGVARRWWVLRGRAGRWG